MIKFFEYNWQVRDEWFEWCNQLSIEELLQKRNGGVGSILYTLFHIIDVEYSWIRGIKGEKDRIFVFHECETLEKIKNLSIELRGEIIEFLKHNANVSDEIVKVSWDTNTYTKNEILHHIIAHEIHHIGQLSVWARELNLSPVPANFIGRKFNEI
ncbi:DinB family protein [Lysinibacillus sp. NPDC059133]|uniref:DinB family protein n=1 Tax=Lysinibacillus sp. NPDC059133 TaxID=3346737 RepID=UPI0036875F00